MESEGRQVHALAEEARERGDFEEALQQSDAATIVYQRDGDLLGMAEVQSSRQSTFKHLYRSTGDQSYLILEKHSALAAVEIAELSGKPEALGIPYHNLGKYYFENNEFDKAADYFKKGADNLTEHPQERHGRAAVIADIRSHQYAAEYKAGDTSTLERAEQALSELEAADEPNPYNKAVWLSGAHLRIADMLMETDTAQAKVYLAKAKEIIDANPDLVLRREQFDRLAEQFPA